jgi:hypothetical protein
MSVDEDVDESDSVDGINVDDTDSLLVVVDGVIVGVVNILGNDGNGLLSFILDGLTVYDTDDDTDDDDGDGI